MKPLAIDLYCGLGGWTEGLLAEGWEVVGFDIERHAYGDHRYPAQLVLQDVRMIHGARFKDAALIVASSPCQEFSYRAMPWKRARELGPPDLGMELFAQAFRIQREAIEAAGRFIPMVQENVRGAQKWAGRARWHYGSFYLWGDVPALMPITMRSVKVSTMGAGWYPPDHPKHTPGLAFNTHAERALLAEDSVKVGGARGDDWFAHHNRPEFGERASKNDGGSWFNVAHNTTSGKGRNPDGRKVSGIKLSEIGFNVAAARLVTEATPDNYVRTAEEKRQHIGYARKAAAARIAKIPLPLARHIAKVWYPRD